MRNCRSSSKEPETGIFVHWSGILLSLISIIRDQQTGIPELDTKCRLVLSEISIRDWVIFTLISIIRGQEFGRFSEISKEELLNQGLDVLCTEQYYLRLAKKTGECLCTLISNIGDQVLITSQGDPVINNPKISVKLTFGSHFKRTLAQRSGYTRKGIIKLPWVSLKYS